MSPVWRRRDRRCTETLAQMFGGRVNGVSDLRCDLYGPHEVHRIDRATPPIVWRVHPDGTIEMGQQLRITGEQP